MRNRSGNFIFVAKNYFRTTSPAGKNFSPELSNAAEAI
jgi:hypothetical protein